MPGFGAAIVKAHASGDQVLMFSVRDWSVLGQPFALEVKDEVERWRTGKICGALPHSDLSAWLSSISAQDWQAVGLKREDVVAAVAKLQPDLDANDDGHQDTVSFALVFDSIMCTTRASGTAGRRRRLRRRRRPR